MCNESHDHYHKDGNLMQSHQRGFHFEAALRL